MTDFTGLDRAVARFRKGSPNIAAAFDEVKRLLDDTPAPGSVWTRPVPPNPPVAPVSAAYVDELVNERLARHQFMVIKDGYTVPVYRATASAPRRDVRLLYDNSGFKLTNCPLDPRWKPSSGTDAHLAVIDTDGCEYNFWGYGWDGPGTAGSAIAFRPGGERFSTTRNACRAAGAALTAGLILRSEIDAGRIPHALAFATQPATRYGTVVAPATDGWQDGLSQPGPRIPVGARIQLDPSISVSTYTNPGDRIVLKALQEFGAILVDGGGFGFYAEDELTAGKYLDWPLGGARMLPNMKKHLRVLAHGSPVLKTPAGYNGPETCGKSRVVAA